MTTLRPGRDEDAGGFIALITACWSEYPGCIMDVDGEVPELRALASHYAARGGALWAAEAAGAVVGMVSTAPLQSDAAWEIGKLYVARGQRGTGLAHRLLDAAEAHARAAGAQRLVLWTDTRFDAAHRFYEKRSFVRAGSIRILDDISRSLEFRYAKPLVGMAVEVLDAAAAASAERRLAELLCACVAGGAAVSFVPPLSLEAARAFWRRAAAQVATADRLLLVAWVDGVITGTVTLDLATPPDQRHRAELQTLLVDPAARRRGVGRELMLRAEQAALRVGRRLLTLETNAGGIAEGLFRALGWTEAGRIPGYAVDPDGTPKDSVFFYRTPA
jgi:GNAT superfamily N-acetyltransferase